MVSLQRVKISIFWFKAKKNCEIAKGREEKSNRNKISLD